MHRSGTSLFTHYLSKSGIELGDQLLSPDRGNPKGYFEDKNIVELHNDILRANGFHYLFNIKKLPTLDIDEKYKKRASKIVLQKGDCSSMWGWKDPRTSILLNFWQKILPNGTKYIFLFRHPISVCDSLIRRDTDEMIKKEPVIGLKSWNIYNRKILSFLSNGQKDALLINIDSFLENEKKYRKIINKKIGINITNKSNKIIDKKLIKKESAIKTWHMMKLKHPILYINAMYIYNKMYNYELIK